MSAGSGINPKRSGISRNGLFVLMLLRALSQASGTSSIPSDVWKKVVRSFSDRPWIIPEVCRDGGYAPVVGRAARAPAVASSTHDATTADDHAKDFMAGKSSMAFTD